MPTYEYVCAKCGHQFDKFQSMKDDALKVCPKELCKMKKWGKGRVQRQVGSGAGLIFKGSGFYITDYRSEGYKAAAKKEAGGEAKPGGESKAGGEAKPSGEGKKSEGKTEGKAPAAAPAAKTESKSASPAAKSKSDSK